MPATEKAPATVEAPATEKEPAPAGAASVAEQPPAPGREERSRRDAIVPRGRATCDSQGRALASLGQLEERAPSFAPAAAVAEGGVLAALPALLQAGLLGHLGALRVGKGFYGLHSTLLVLAFLLPARVRNRERLGWERVNLMKQWICISSSDVWQVADFPIAMELSGCTLSVIRCRDCTFNSADFL